LNYPPVISSLVLRVDELKDAESGLDAAGIVIEFNMIDMGIAEEMNKRMDKMMKNFQSGK